MPDLRAQTAGPRRVGERDRTRSLERRSRANCSPARSKAKCTVAARSCRAVERLLVDAALDALALARKAGRAVAGFDNVKVRALENGSPRSYMQATRAKTAAASSTPLAKNADPEARWKSGCFRGDRIGLGAWAVKCDTCCRVARRGGSGLSRELSELTTLARNGPARRITTPIAAAAVNEIGYQVTDGDKNDTGDKNKTLSLKRTETAHRQAELQPWPHQGRGGREEARTVGSRRGQGRARRSRRRAAKTASRRAESARAQQRAGGGRAPPSKPSGVVLRELSRGRGENRATALIDATSREAEATQACRGRRAPPRRARRRRARARTRSRRGGKRKPKKTRRAGRGRSPAARPTKPRRDASANAPSGAGQVARPSPTSEEEETARIAERRQDGGSAEAPAPRPAEENAAAAS